MIPVNIFLISKISSLVNSMGTISNPCLSRASLANLTALTVAYVGRIVGNASKYPILTLFLPPSTID